MVVLEMAPDLSHETVRQVLGKKPAQAASTPDVVHPARTIGGVRGAHGGRARRLYCRPIDPLRPLVCLDEISVQLIGEVRPPRPVRRGRVARYDSEYVRNGTTNLFMAFAPLTGQRLASVTDQRRRGDFARFVKALVDEQYPDAERIVLVMDQLTPTASSRSTKPSRRPRPAASQIDWRSITRPSTAPGSTWPRSS